MQLTVKQLIDKLQEFPAEAAIRLEDLDDDHELFLVSFQSGLGRLTIVITNEEEEDEEQKEEEEKEYG
ncbi:hypothetical protein [Nostoc sp.]|uniref:hypothetical protein n=1 Tax=Nostoc sp. TaxID=1180 RepID=UPI002FFBE80E